VVAASAETLSLPPEEARARLARDLGYVSAKVGADAAIFDDEERILLVHRSDDLRWGLVSGWVDPGETPAETVVREVKEEVGLDATVLELVDAIGCPAGTLAGPHGLVSVLYLCSVGPGSIRICHESIDAQYRAIDDVTEWHSHHQLLARRALEAHRARQSTET
jgi:8-oxo-dGTP pyrophosphatase MutT (NUDIX family)